MKYKSYSRLFVIFVLADYLITLTSIILVPTGSPTILSLVSSVFYVLLFMVFSSIVFYKFYNSFFEKKLWFGLSGIITMFLGIIGLYLKRYVSLPILQQIVFLLFFTSLIVLYSIILIPIIKNKSVNEFHRGLYIFLFLLLTLPVINSILKSVITNYFIMDIERYISRISSTSFLVFIFYYFFLVKDDIMKNPKVSKFNVFIIISVLILLLSFSLYFRNSDMYSVVVSIYTAISIKLYLPFYIYLFTTAIFIITFVVGLIFSSEKILFIPLALIAFTGLNTGDFYIRVVSIFALIDIYAYNNFIFRSPVEKSE